MFRRKEDTLEPDASFEAALKSLGFFVNKVGHIRMIEAPEKPFIFHATNNERVNEVRREAMQVCQREESEKRLSALGINRVYLPGFSTTKPNGPHIPMLAPSPEILKKRKRVIVLVNDTLQDLGILAYRQLQRELGINGGSVVNFVKELIQLSADSSDKNYEGIFDDGAGVQQEDDVPALVVMNTGQLLYSHKHNRVMTMRSWSAMPRKSIAHDMIRIHGIENYVDGHRNAAQHVKSIFDDVLCNPERVSSQAEIYLIAIENGTESVLNVLSGDFEKYGTRLTAMALVHCTIDDVEINDPKLKAFLHQRTRHWRYSDITSNPENCTDLPDNYAEGFEDPQVHVDSTSKISEHIRWSEDIDANALLKVTEMVHRLSLKTHPTNQAEGGQGIQPNTTSRPPASSTDAEWSTCNSVICPTFGGGGESVGECVFTNPNVQHAIIFFFNEVAQDPENYRNPMMKTGHDAPQPTPDKPLTLSPTEFTQAESLPAEMMPEHLELDEARQTLEDMRIALAACPEDDQHIAKSRERLIKRIQAKIIAVDDLEKKVLAGGGLKAGEGIENRENWKPQKEGKKVPFAGSMVDSELLKGAGLLDTADEELEKLDDGEGKAFI